MKRLLREFYRHAWPLAWPLTILILATPIVGLRFGWVTAQAVNTIGTVLVMLFAGAFLAVQARRGRR